jgi:hypothetical protein
MDAQHSSEISVNFYQTTQRHNPEESALYIVYDTQLLPIVRMTSGMHVSMESKAMQVSQECGDK